MFSLQDNLSITALTLIGVATIIYFAYTRYLRSYHLLPPGPKGVPLLGNLPFLDPQLHSYFTGLAQTYGPIVKLHLGGKLGIIISSPAAAREALKDHDITFANRVVPKAAEIFSFGGSDIVWSPYGPDWRMLRKVCVQKMLSKTTMDSVYMLRRNQVRETVRYIYSRVESEVNIGEQIFLTIFNVITNMLWGGTVHGEERESLGSEFRQVVCDMVDLIAKPNLSDFFPCLARFDLQGIEKQMKCLAKKFDGIFETMIEKRIKMEKEDGGGGKHKDFLQFLLKLKEEGDAKTPLTMIQIKALLMDMVIGGTQTSSNTIEFAMAEIMNNPIVLKNIQQELDSVIGKDKIVEESHIYKLPYLHAVMKEVLRLHPTVAILTPRSLSETCIIQGYMIPKGSIIFINVWAIHRDPSIWKNPLEFDPERFLKGSGDYNGNDFNYFPFGSGKRSCPGIAMAERMVLYSLATLLHSFDWRFPDGEKMDLTEHFSLALKKKRPLVGTPKPRLSDPTFYE